jgi:hypothetical protein
VIVVTSAARRTKRRFVRIVVTSAARHAVHEAPDRVKKDLQA